MPRESFPKARIRIGWTRSRARVQGWVDGARCQAEPRWALRQLRRGSHYEVHEEALTCRKNKWTPTQAHTHQHKPLLCFGVQSLSLALSWGFITHNRQQRAANVTMPSAHQARMLSMAARCRGLWPTWRPTCNSMCYHGLTSFYYGCMTCCSQDLVMLSYSAVDIGLDCWEDCREHRRCDCQ